MFYVEFVCIQQCRTVTSNHQLCIFDARQGTLSRAPNVYSLDQVVVVQIETLEIDELEQ